MLCAFVVIFHVRWVKLIWVKWKHLVIACVFVCPCTSCRWDTVRPSPRPVSSRPIYWVRYKGRALLSSWTHWCRTTERNNWCRTTPSSRLNTKNTVNNMISDEFISFSIWWIWWSDRPNMLRRPTLSMRRAETMLPGNTASVPRKLMKYTQYAL